MEPGTGVILIYLFLFWLCSLGIAYRAGWRRVRFTWDRE